jgi:hypothetical protein
MYVSAEAQRLGPTSDTITSAVLPGFEIAVGDLVPLVS